MSSKKDPTVSIVLKIVFSALSIALVFLGTYSFRIPILATGGYFNFGDIMIFIAALTFGPLAGGIGGGIGSSLSDLLGGYSTFAPFTLVIKGLEGTAAGLVAQRKFRRNLSVAWLVAGSIMVGGYFLTESYLIALFFGASETTGVVAALAEVPGNLLQVFAGGLVGIPVSLTLRRRFPTLFPREKPKPSSPSLQN